MADFLVRRDDLRTTRVEDPDERDLQSLYDTLEGEVLPTFADQSRWTRMMRASIRMAVERFSADRMVKEYFERLYAARAAAR